MGRSHAISGAAGWLGLCLAAKTSGVLDPEMTTVAAGAVVAAGAALWPDIDHEGSTVARTLGPITQLGSRLVSFVADAVRDGTCGCCATDSTRGHRTLTHTVVFAILCGPLVGAAGWWWGTRAAAVLIGVAGWLAVRGVWPRRFGGLAGLIAGAGAGYAVWWLGEPDGWWWLGLPMSWGVLAHILGDAITHHGVPLWWPLRIQGCRWRRVGTPEWARFRTGGLIEAALCVLMLAGGTAAGWALIG